MRIGKVIGQLVACEVYEGLEGVPLLWIQPCDKTGKPKGKATVMADPTRMAGLNELVFYEGGREAALLLEPWFVPVDYAVVGIVDQLNIPKAVQS
jgi:ethanolamine utilization protein EutN